MDALGPRIKRLRQQANLNKAALARLVGVSDVTISYWESGAIKQIGHERLVALAEALGCPLSELLDDQSPSAPTEILQLNATPPVPWRDAPRQGIRMPSEVFTFVQEPQIYLITPAPGSEFDYLESGDLAAIQPTTQIRRAGIYVVEYLGRIELRRLEGETTPADDNLHVLGKMEAHWQLAS